MRWTESAASFYAKPRGVKLPRDAGRSRAASQGGGQGMSGAREAAGGGSCGFLAKAWPDLSRTFAPLAWSGSLVCQGGGGAASTRPCSSMSSGRRAAPTTLPVRRRSSDARPCRSPSFREPQQAFFCFFFSFSCFFSLFFFPFPLFSFLFVPPSLPSSPPIHPSIHPSTHPPVHLHLFDTSFFVLALAQRGAPPSCFALLQIEGCARKSKVS